MAWTYQPGQLATSPMMQVRLLIGDTLSSDQQMQDEEILYFISTRNSLYGAAAECCRTLASKFGRSVDLSAGQSKNMYSQMAKAYTRRAFEFEQQAAMAGSATPYAGGISIADKSSQEQNQDRVTPQFNVGMMDNTDPVAPAGNETEEDFGTGV